MYTQCPDCATAFRVTAEILKQAGGKVRCGGCGIAFNALANLSETKPGAAPSPQPDDVLPELTPEAAQDANETPPQRAISPEQSAALLQTLDELSGTDIRLEDTGVEWRLMPDEEDEDADYVPDDYGTYVDAELSGDTGNTAIDEILDDTPAELDEFLVDAPSEVDAGEVFGVAASPVESPGDGDGPEGAPNPDDELRFDDHTGLPGDDAGDDSGVAPVVRFETRAEPEPEPEFIEPSAHTETQVDMVFGEPDEWGELLDEVEVVADDDSGDAIVIPGEIIEPESSDEDSGARSLTLADELDALGDELNALGHELDDAGDARPADETLTTAGDDVQPEPARVQDLSDRILSALSRHGVEDVEDFDDDDDTAAEFIATGSGFDELTRALGDAGDEPGDLAAEPRAEDAAVEVARDAGTADVTDVSEDPPDAVAIVNADDGDAVNAPDVVAGDTPDAADVAAEVDVLADEIELADVEIESAADEADSPEPAKLPEGEQEQAIDRLIDQDLLGLAADGDDDEGDDEPSDVAAAVKGVPGFPPVTGGVETIIMEGESVRTALEEEALKAEAKREQQPEENAFIAAARKTFRGTMSRHDDETATPAHRHRIAAGLTLLGLLLAGQLVHQSRAELATIPAVNNLITPIYRLLGSPITPHWDVTGWQFEVTRETLSGGEPVAAAAAPPAGDAAATGVTPAAEGGTGAGDGSAGIDEARTPEILTIYSRLGNSADHPLPYPLITVSLTDRYEETIGSTILEPSDYLPSQADTSRLISPGNTFEAVIPIASPSGAATGYKLNVCYRQAGRTLRCAVEDFK